MSAVRKMHQPLGLYARQLLERAREFLEAFSALDDGTDRLMHARYSLLFHAVELGIKSYLAASGVSKHGLSRRPYGHNLVLMLNAAEMRGVAPCTEFRMLTANLHEMNSDYDFRYPTSYNLHVMSPRHALEAASSFLAAISQTVVSAALKAEMEFHAREDRSPVEWDD